jgi:YebC/PmpR family DNA-binding regulatory protein
MSGHSKWSTIKHKKAANDAKKGKVFTKLAKLITVAVKTSGIGDPASSPSLRLLVEKARQENMPSDNVRRAIDRGLGKGDNTVLEEIMYEGYGPSGVGIMVKVVTDNRNRTGSEVRTIFDKNGGSLAGPGAVSYMKHLDPIPMVTLEGEELDKVLALLDLLDDNDDVVEVWSNLTYNAEEE